MAIPNSFMTLRDAPDRYGFDVQTLPIKPQIYKRCECGAMIYQYDWIWSINGTDFCKYCVEEGLVNCRRKAE